MAVAAARRKDFLRHIVNRVLARPDVPRQIVEDIRRHVGRAEDKYKFHAFGGDVKRLADYLRSRDFDDLINVAKSDRSGKGLEVLRAILEEARKAYNDIPEVVAAIEERLRQLEEIGREREEEREEERAADIYTRLERLAGGPVKVTRSDGTVVVTLSTDNRSAKINVGYDAEAKKYRVEARAEAELRSPDEAIKLVKGLVDLLKE